MNLLIFLGIFCIIEHIALAGLMIIMFINSKLSEERGNSSD